MADGRCDPVIPGVAPREERTAAGVGLMACAVAVFTCIDTSAKWLILAGLPPLQVVFARFAGHFLYALAIYLPREGAGALRSHAPRQQLLRAGFLTASTFFNFLALSHLPITVTTTIFFTMPIVVTLLAIPILGERVGLRRILAVCTGFGGVLLVMQPWGAVWHPAMIYSLCALLVASLYFIMTRKLAGVESQSAQQIWSSGVATLALTPIALTLWVWPAGPAQWAVFLVIGAFGFGGHVMATTAHRWADASILSPLVYTQVLWSSVAGVVVFATWPSPWTLAGGAVIIASGLYIWRRERAVKGE